MLHILEHNGKSYAVGLWWQVADHPVARKMLEQARATAQSAGEEFNCVVLLPRQYGLGHVDGRIPRVRSLAASMKPGHASYLGIFRLEEALGDDGLWWVCALRQGMITAEGDRLCSTREEAQRHAHSLREIGGAFDHEETFGSVSESLSALSGYLAPASILFGTHALRPLNDDADRSRHRKLLAAAAAALLLLAYGIHQWTLAREEAEQRQLAQLAMASREASRKALLASGSQHFGQPWNGQVQPLDRAAQCLKAMMTTPLFASGWKLEAVTCADDAVITRWEHQAGASYTSLPAGTRLDSSTVATGRVALPPATGTRSADQPLRTVGEAYAHLYQVTQEAAARLRLTFDLPDRKTVDGVELVAPWIRGQWEMSDLPQALLEDLAVSANLQSCPGLVLTGIEFKGGAWTFRGNIYATK